MRPSKDPSAYEEKVLVHLHCWLPSLPSPGVNLSRRDLRSRILNSSPHLPPRLSGSSRILPSSSRTTVVPLAALWRVIDSRRRPGGCRRLASIAAAVCSKASEYRYSGLFDGWRSSPGRLVCWIVLGFRGGASFDGSPGDGRDSMSWWPVGGSLVIPRMIPMIIH